MYIEIENQNYTDIVSLDFAPEADLTGSSLPVNQFSADIRTGDQIPLNVPATLYNDGDDLWAAYTVVDVATVQPGVKRIIAQSAIALLSKRRMAPAMYNGSSVSGVLSDIFTGFESGAYNLDSSFSGETVSGFCPEQSARERLQWVLFVIGAYVKTYFSDVIQILPLDDDARLIPVERTYWKPQISVEDYVTKITVKAYSYTEGTPAPTDEWVQVGNTYYIQSEQEFSLSNHDVPAYVMENEIVIDRVTIINAENADDILSRLADDYFNRISLQADVLDNGEFFPGQKVLIYTAENGMMSGYVKSAAFSFGLQAKASFKLSMCENVSVAALIINAIWDRIRIGQRRYTLPIGYQYDIKNLFVDLWLNDHRYVFRPENESASGIMPDTDTEKDEPYDIALDLFEGNLFVISVDGLTDNEGVVSIA